MIPVVKSVDLSPLYAPFRDKLQPLYDACVARGAEYWIICSYRSWADQDKLYAQGRTVLKDGKGNKLGKVTNAKGGESPHQFFIAVDWCRNFNPGGPLKPNWPQQKPEHYKILAEEAAKLGLEPGLNWKFSDPPHIQLNIDAKHLTWAQFREAYHQDGIPGVLSFLDKHGPW